MGCDIHMFMEYRLAHVPPPSSQSIAEIAAAYGRARYRLAVARRAEQEAQEALTNATTDRRNAEDDERVALELLDLAIQEDS